MIAKRHEYVQALFTNEALPKGERLRNVYMDESYIHEHYNKNDWSVWDPKDVLDIQHGKSKDKGRRYCFAAAIQGPDPFVDVPELASEKAGLVPGPFGHSVFDQGKGWQTVQSGFNFGPCVPAIDERI
jgi:hypothetical protein